VNSLSQTASRHALRLTGGGLTAVEVADSTRDYLRGLSGAYLKDVLGGAVQQSMNAGRKLVFARDGEQGEVYASELLDANTCSECAGVDGTPYDTLSSAEQDYPGGGYKDCEGNERCRGTLVKVYSTEVAPTA
jgi:histone H3/H4